MRPAKPVAPLFEKELAKQRGEKMLESGSKEGHHHAAEAGQSKSGSAAGRFAHDWNVEGAAVRSATPPKVLDETLRDGLQSTSVRDPSIGEKLELLHHMVQLGIDTVSIGIPCAHKRQYDDALRLAREIADQRLPVTACCAARTREEDIQLVAEISQRAGIPLEVGTFVGSSPIRQHVEDWTLDHLERLTHDAVTFAKKCGLHVLYVTEDSTRSSPDVLARLYGTAIRCGAERVCVADTVGHATPSGTAKIVAFIAARIAEIGAPVGIDWHGHRDRGLELANCFAAWSAGAERCHGTALGVGERAGNTPIELLLVNLHLGGFQSRDLSTLTAYVTRATEVLGVNIPRHYPVFGADAFRTATGVHASAMVKAQNLSDSYFEQLYSAVPSSLVGRRHVIEVGPMSGESNVRHLLKQCGIRCDDDIVRELVAIVKKQNRVLSRQELTDLARRFTEDSSIRQARSAHRPSDVPPAFMSGSSNGH
jgi:2-isopropylmalate synthase